MQTIEIMTQAKDLYARWESKGRPGFWLEFWEKATGCEFGSAEYDLVHEMTVDGLLG